MARAGCNEPTAFLGTDSTFVIACRHSSWIEMGIDLIAICDPSWLFTLLFRDVAVAFFFFFFFFFFFWARMH